jgi:hypothetical protein
MVLFCCALYILKDGNHVSAVYTPLTVLFFFGLCALSLPGENKKVLWGAGLFVVALALRSVALRVWQIRLTSDALATFDLARLLRSARFADWGELINATAYGNDWSAQLPYVIYETFILRVFGDSVLFVQIVNMLFSSASVLFAYLIAGAIFGYGRRAALAGLLMAFNPTAVLMTAFTANQHAATCLFLVALWFSIRKPISAGPLNAAVAGFFAALSHLIRPEMFILLIAVAVCAAYEAIREKSAKTAAVELALFVCLFFAVILPAYAAVDRTANDAPNSAFLYKLAVGLNDETDGKYNLEDYAAAGDGESLKERIKERLRIGPIGLAKLMARKTLFQFSSYDYWNLHTDLSGTLIPGGKAQTFLAAKVFYPATQGFALLLMLFAGVDLLAGLRGDKRPILPAVVFFGFVLAFALIEVQQRYNYPMLPLFSVWAAGGAHALLSPSGLAFVRGVRENKIVSAVVYLIMLLLALAFFTGNGEFIYEAF